MSWRQFIIAIVFMGSGLCLCLPTVVILLSYRLAPAELVAVYPLPEADDRIRLVTAFEFTVEDPVHIEASRLEVIGSGLSDAYGQALADEVVEDWDAFAARREHLLARERRLGKAFYDPADPVGSARFVSEGGFWRYHLGLMLLAAPPIVWLSSAISRMLREASRAAGVTRRRRITADEPTDPGSVE